MKKFDPSDRDCFRRVEKIFLQVCDLEDELQEVRVRELCEQDQQMMQSVLDMLNADSQSGSLLDFDAVCIEQEKEPYHSKRLGDFCIVRKLGEGGMGVVYEAIQDSPRRHVALKVIKQRSMHSKIRKRFEREADILAKLNHRAIATIYESGVAQDETKTLPFVSMELVIGTPITTYCQNQKLSINERLSLLCELCQGVGYAHDLGIIHRDLKPSNILVDQTGQVKILDFGIAFDMAIEQRTQITQTGQLLGTLEYMAPEQVDQQSNSASKQTDVYALGLMCYEILTGENPFDREDLSVYALVRSIRDDDPNLLGTHDRNLRGDLEIIVAKSLDREIGRRYIDANALADDLNKYVSNQPIAARKPSTWYQFRKFSKRNPVLVGAVVVIMLVLSAAILLIGNALRLANTQREAAQHEQVVQSLMSAFVTDDLFAAGDPEYDGDARISLIEAMRQSTEGIGERFQDAPEAEALIRFTMGEQFRRMNDYDLALTNISKSVEMSEMLDLPAEIIIDRRNSLSDVYMDIDDLESALNTVEVTDSLVIDHPEISPELKIDTLVQHASLLYHMANAAEAAIYFQQAVDIGRSQVPDYTGTTDAISALAIVYTRLERYQESMKLHLEGINLLTQQLGEDHPATINARENLALLYLQREDYQEAANRLEQVLAKRTKVFGENHIKTHLTTAGLGKCYSLLGNNQLAEQYLLASYDGLMAILGPDHRYTKIVRSYAYNHFTRTNQPASAQKFAAPANSE